MKEFISKRNQVIDGKHVAEGDKVKVAPERVAYLIARGHLEEVTKKGK